MATLNAIHQKLHVRAQQVGADIDAIFFCPHAAADELRLPQAEIRHVRGNRPAASRSAWKGVPTVGDSLRDLQAGLLLGCGPTWS